MPSYRTKEGDVLDAICEAYYGRTAQVVERVLQANPGLANKGAIYPSGILIELPDLPEQLSPIQPIRLWE